MRRALLLLLPAVAAADTRIDLSPMPELMLLEPAYHLDRDTDADARTKRGIASSFGFGRGDGGIAGEATVVAASRSRQSFASASSELVVAGNELVRGRHQGYLRLYSDEKIGGVAALGGSIEHGKARALAPVAIGPGERDHVAAFGDELIALDGNRHDGMWGVLVRVDGSATRWLDSPLLDYGYRGSIASGIAATFHDEELPRGRIEGVVVRLEEGRTIRKLAAAGSVSVAEAATHTIEVMSGVNELTGWIDHELLVAFTARFGMKHVDVEAAGRQREDNMFAMQLGLHLEWRDDGNVRELGLAITRDPTASPDGSGLLSETRVQFVGGAEGRYYAVDMRGGMSWDVPQDVDGRVHTRHRYGAALEGFVKIALGVEVGGYHMSAFEPQVAGDPFASFGTWTSETGFLVRRRMR